MAKHVWWCTAALLLFAGSAATDSIIIDGTVYTGVKITETASLYYVRIPDARPISVPKSKIKPDEIVFGDKPLPAPAPPVPPEPIAPAPEPPPPPAEPQPLSAGAARLVVSKAPDPANQLEVNALVFQSGATTVAFCVLDTAALDRSLVDAIAGRLQAEGSAVNADTLWLSATGVPTGRYSGLFRNPIQECLFGPFDKAAFDEAAGHAVEAIRAAETALRPARLRIGEAEVPEFQELRGDGGTTADATLSVLGVETDQGEPLAYLVNYALEPPPLLASAGAGAGTMATGHRGAPGMAAQAIRKTAGGEIPVLFVQGAAGDIAPQAPENSLAALGQGLAQAALEALKGSVPRGMVQMRCLRRTAPLPPTLLAGSMPADTILQELHIDDTVLLSLPGAPAAQIGVLLRVKAMAMGAEHVLLCGLTGDYLGFQPTVEEYFAMSAPARWTFYGPLLVTWYGEHHLADAVAEGGEPVWNSVPALARYASAFRAGLERGQQEREMLATRWSAIAASLDVRHWPREEDAESHRVAEQLERRTGAAYAKDLALEMAAVQARGTFADFTEEQRVILMGVAEGAALPFDAVLLMQVLAHPEALPKEVAEAAQAAGAEGYDLLKS